MKLVLKENGSEGTGLLCAGLLLGACWAASCCGRSSGCAGVFWGMLCCSWFSAEWFCTEDEPEAPPACIGSSGDGAATG